MLLENPSTYVAFESSTMSEIEFLSEVVARTGCGLLLDVNNVHVSADQQWLRSVRLSRPVPGRGVSARSISAAMRRGRDADGAPLLIDSHADPVADPVWALYEHAIERAGPVPTLIEWDNDVPAYAVLAAEAARAMRVMICRNQARERRGAGHGFGQREPICRPSWISG